MTLSETHKLPNSYCGKRVLVTGATGFVGSHLLATLKVSGAEVTVVTRKAFYSSHVHRVSVGNIVDKNFIQQVIHECTPNIIFHLAGARDRTLDRDAFDHSMEVNLTGTLNLLFASIDAPRLERIVILGTGEEYGRNPAPFLEIMRESPISAYSFSKQCATHLSQLMHASFGVPVVILRPAVVYGPSQQSDMFLPALIQTLLRGEAFPMTQGDQTRDYIYVVDLVDALLLAGTRLNVDGEVINIASGRAIKIKQLVDCVEALLGGVQLAKRGALNYRTGESMDYWLDITKARQLLDWFPRTSLMEGLQQTITHFKSIVETGPELDRKHA